MADEVRELPQQRLHNSGQDAGSAAGTRPAFLFIFGISSEYQRILGWLMS